MSYVLTPFLIDLEKLRKAVGSRDESLMAAVIDGQPRRFPAEDDSAGGLSRRDALRELVMGSDLDPNSGAQYGFALEGLCRHLGDEILPDAWGGVSWAAIEATGLEETLTGSGPPVPLPSVVGFPLIAYLTAEEAADKSAELADAEPAEEDEDLEEMLDEFRGWLRRAVSQGKDVVFFYR